MGVAPSPLRVGVRPAAEAARCARLLDAVALAEPATFVACDGDVGGLDAVVDLVAGLPAVALPTLCLAGGDAVDPARESVLALARGAGLARVLHGARLPERGVGVVPDVPPGSVVLASTDAGPAWVREADGREVVAASLGELEDGEALRDHLAPGRCLALLALVHFVRVQAGPRGWQPPPLHATFIFDDPNLHWPSYGHVKYQALVEHAREHRYHTVVAMVPLDAWFTHPRAARLFRDNGDVLSLAVHGNDHLGPELGALQSARDAAAVAGQALRRVGAFERRTGIPVSRVMVPPHERVSEHAGAAIAAAPFDALCTTRPYPWVAPTRDVHWLTRPAEAGPLTGWGCADVVTGGLPVLLRIDFDHPFDEVVLRAFLGQAIILYGHHDALRGGLDRLAERAAAINALGDVTWGTLGDLAASRVRVRVRREGEGETLAISLAARRTGIVVPPDATSLRVDATAFGPDAIVTAAIDGATPQPVGDTPLPVPGGASVALAVAQPATTDLGDVPSPPRRLWPIARRLAGESRDRLQGLR